MLEDLSGHASASTAGSAHTTQLLNEHLVSHGAAATDAASLAELFAAQWARYLELMVSDDGATVAIMTRGRGRKFMAQVGSLLQCCEIEPTVAAQMLGLADALHHCRCLVRLSFAAANGQQPEVSVTYRRAMHLEHGLRLIDADAATRLEVQGFAALLHQSALHGISLSARRGTVHVRHGVHFAQVVTERRREQVRMRLAHAASRHAPCAAAVSCWAEHHDLLLAGERRVLSTWLMPGRGAQGTQIGIEYPEVTVPAAVRLLEHRAPEVTERFERLCARAGRATLSYLEVGLQQAIVPGLYGYACMAH